MSVSPRTSLFVAACLYPAACALAAPASGVESQDLDVVLSAQGGESSLSLTWGTEDGFRYELQSSPDMEVWTAVDGFPQDGTGEDMSTPAGWSADGLFYRVVRTDAPGEQLRYLEKPEVGQRYPNFAAFDGPSWPTVYGNAHVTLWHRDTFAAYSVTIDDNNSPDFPFWTALAEETGFKFTWFVIVYPYTWDIYEDKPGSNTGYFGTLAEFAELSEMGHDIQLHGACGSMNDLSEADYEDHIVRSINALEGATGKPILTFAYPCGKPTSNDGTQNYKPIIAKYMIGARGTTGGPTPVHRLDYLGTQSLGGNYLVDGAPSSTMMKIFTQGNFNYSYYRGWCVTLYHGMDDAGEVKARELLLYMKAHEDEYWVAPFTDVSKYAQERESSTLTMVAVEADLISFRVRDRMDDTIYTHPLTVKVVLDASWTSINATQAGEVIPARIVEHEGRNYAIVEPVPDKGLVVLTK